MRRLGERVAAFIVRSILYTEQYRRLKAAADIFLDNFSTTLYNNILYEGENLALDVGRAEKEQVYGEYS